MERLLQGVEDEARLRAATGAPADDPACIGIDDKGDIDGRDVGSTTQPFRIPDVIRIERHHGALGRHLSHPAPFPVKFAEHILRAYADEGDIVYEPFGGRHQSHRG